MAVNVRGLPVNPGAVAVSVYGPAVLPRIQLPTAAMPVASVVWFAPVTVPPPVPGANVTATPATGLLLASRTITDGGMATAVPVIAFWPLPAFMAIWVAAPAVTLTVAEVPGVYCCAEQPSVWCPAVHLIT